MAGIDEREARAVLQAMLPRLGEPPHALLGVPPDAPLEAMRAAFLRLTKQFHPTKFARHAPDVVRLANEVFLTIKRAYDQLTAGPARGTGARPVVPVAPPRVVTQPGPPPRPRPPASTAPRAAAPPKPTLTPKEQAWEDALELLRRKLWGEARQAFQKLAVADPQEKRYRAHMHYARGREAAEGGRPDEARAELQRALALEPTLRAAQLALDDLPPPAGGGLMSRIFKRS